MDNPPNHRDEMLLNRKKGGENGTSISNTRGSTADRRGWSPFPFSDSFSFSLGCVLSVECPFVSALYGALASAVCMSFTMISATAGVNIRRSNPGGNRHHKTKLCISWFSTRKREKDWRKWEREPMSVKSACGFAFNGRKSKHDISFLSLFAIEIATHEP